MKIVKKYSHLNGEEYLIVHKLALYEEIQDAIATVDASRFKTKVSKERGRQGEMLYSPGDLNKEFERVFGNLGWQPVTRHFYVSDNFGVVETIELMDYEEQRAYLESIGAPLIQSYNQINLVKDLLAL